MNEKNFLELVVNLTLIIIVIINTIVFIKVLQKYVFLRKFSENFEKEMKDLTKILGIKEDL